MHRLKKFDEATGHVAQPGDIDEHTDNGLNVNRTGHVHQAARQDNVFHWLDGIQQDGPTEGKTKP